MFNIKPGLLSDTSQSPYRRAFERGHRYLRFEAALERPFLEFYTQPHLVRFACFIGITFVSLFVLIDISTLPAHVAVWTAGIRVSLVIAYVLVILISYRPAWRHHLQVGAFVASLITGLGSVAIIGTVFGNGVQTPYEGILLVALFLYVIVGLPLWRALLINGLTLLAFVVMEVIYQNDPQMRFNQIFYMCLANAVGAHASYFAEHSTRTTFVVHALLRELAERDGLTGLYDRRMLDTHVDRVWRQAIREQRALAIAMIDVDFFKLYNDRYGHAKGDAALKAMAAVIASHARRPLDLAARYGGEEFAIVWYQEAPGELANMGENLRAAVVALGLAHEDSELGELSVSIGVALTMPVAGQSSAALFLAADTALYQAKHQGRNRVVVVTCPTVEAELDSSSTATA